MKLGGEPRKQPMNRYHKGYQDLYFKQGIPKSSLREHMERISEYWQLISESLKECNKRQAAELQKAREVDMDLWLSSLC